jgi:hypothetical protein
MTDRDRFTIHILPSCPLFREGPRIYDARLCQRYDDAMDDATYFLVETLLVPHPAPNRTAKSKRTTVRRNRKATAKTKQGP